MNYYNMLLLSSIISVIILSSCGTSSENEMVNNDQTRELPGYLNTDSVQELTPEQQEAFDALNELQISTSGHLYSSFPNSQNSHLTPDSSFTISQTTFKEVLTRITNSFGNKYSNPQYEKLIEKSILAANTYFVEFYESDEGLEPHSIPIYGLPTNGKWIIRGVLDLRDIILDWIEPSGLK